MKKIVLTLALAFVFSLGAFLAPQASADGHGKIAGKFFLQVESSGELWYILPDTGERFYIENAESAFRLLKNTGLGITNKNLEMIEDANGSSDGHYDMALAKRLAGKFLIQVESKGEAWYVNPNDYKRYYLGKPSEAFSLFSSIAKGIDNETASSIDEAKSIVDIAAGAGTFETLLAAATAAGLATTLDQDGPFTVFAPNDDAFSKLPEGTVASLLNDIPALTNILLYHVVPGKVEAAKVISKDSLTTLQGGELEVSTEDGAMVNDSKIIATDLKGVNGIVHVIDSVLLP